MSTLIHLILLALAWALGHAAPAPAPCPAPVVITTPSTPGPEITTPPVSIPGPTIIETTDIPAATADRPYDPATDNDLYTKPTQEVHNP